MSWASTKCAWIKTNQSLCGRLKFILMMSRGRRFLRAERCPLPEKDTLFGKLMSSERIRFGLSGGNKIIVCPISKKITRFIPRVIQVHPVLHSKSLSEKKEKATRSWFSSYNSSGIIIAIDNIVPSFIFIYLHTHSLTYFPPSVEALWEEGCICLEDPPAPMPLSVFQASTVLT